MENPVAGLVRKVLGRGEPAARLSAEEALRIRMWRARASHSRAGGVALLILSGVLLAISFVTEFTGFELTALASFVVGVFLVAVELEPRVKIDALSQSLEGPLLTLSRSLRELGVDGGALYVPGEEGVVMQVSSKSDPTKTSPIDPVGAGLARSFEREIGPLRDSGRDYVRTWVPRVVTKGLGLADGASLKFGPDRVEGTFRRPYVRSLCASEGFNRAICDSIGCPLVSSVGEVISSATGKRVRYLGCRFDRAKQTASASYGMEG